MGEPKITETISLTLDSSNVKGDSLSGLIAQFDAVEAKIREVNAAINGMGLRPGGTARSSDTMLSALQKEKAAIAQVTTAHAEADNKRKKIKKGDITSITTKYDLAASTKALNLDTAAMLKWLEVKSKMATAPRPRGKDAMGEWKAAQAVSGGYDPVAKNFRSMKGVAAAAAAFEAEQFGKAGAGRMSLAQLAAVMSPAGGGGVAHVGKVTAAGGLKLELTPEQIHASVVGTIPLVIRGDQIQAVAGGGVADGGRNAAGQFVAGGGGGGGRKKGSGKGKSPMSGKVIPGELGRVITETEDSLRHAITTLGASGDVITETLDSVEGSIKTVTRRKASNAPLEEFRSARRIVEANFKQAKAILDPNDMGFGLATLQEKQAAQLRALKKNKSLSALPASTRATVEKGLEESARTLEAHAEGSKMGAEARVVEQAKRAQQEKIRAQNRALNERLALAREQEAAELERIKAKTSGFSAADVHRARAGMLRGALGSAPDISAERRAEVGATIAKLEARALVAERRAAAQANRTAGTAAGGSAPTAAPNTTEWWRQYFAQQNAGGNPSGVTWNKGMFQGAPPVLPGSKPMPSAKPTRLQQAYQGLSPMNMAANFVKVATWSMAAIPVYGALTKSIELVTYSMGRLLDVGLQTARLEQVFRGVGGSAQQLAQDVMGLAAMQGRSTEEAMSSAVAWSRLGLTRTQVNEAVRVSLIAANVAELDAGEATGHLSALMNVYGLQVSELEGVLGMLNNTSNKYNVTNADLLEGLSRSAAVARQAGVGLAELQGIIGATVGRTGQSGGNVGNAVKTIIARLVSPETQKVLRGYGVEPTAEGQGKNVSQMLREIFIRFQSLNETEQKNLAIRVAGAHQANRFTAILGGYADAQRLAIDGQLNLNSAQTENAKILGTVKAQMAGVRAEFDRQVVAGGNKKSIFGGGSMMEQAAGGLRTYKNLMKLDGKLPGNFLDWSMPFFAAKLRGLNLLGGVAGRAMTGVSAKEAGGYGATDVFSYSMESPYERGQAAFANRQQELSGKVMASSMQARLFDTATQLSGNGSKATSRVLEVAGNYMSPDQAQALRTARESGDVKAMQNVLQEAKRITLERQSVEMTTLAQEQTVQRGLAESELRKAEAGKDTGAIAAAQKQYDDLNQSLDQTHLKLLEIEGDISAAVEFTGQYLALIKSQAEIMGTVSRLTSQSSTGTAVGGLDERQLALTAQKQFMESELAALNAKLSVNSNPQARALANKIQLEQLPAVTSELEGVQDPRVRRLAVLYDERNIGFKRAVLEAEGMGAGYTESEKLLRQQSGLERQLADPGLEAVKGEAYTVELMKTKEQIQHRLIALKSQEKQIQIESNREFQRSLLFAGPGELLKRLYVANLPQKMSAGQFMGMDTESRKMWYERHGGQAGAKNREEQALMRHPTAGQTGAYNSALGEYQSDLQAYNVRERNGGGRGTPEEAALRGSRSRLEAARRGMTGQGMTVKEEAEERARLTAKHGEYAKSLAGDMSGMAGGLAPANNQGVTSLGAQAQKTSVAVAALGTNAASAATSLGGLGTMIEEMKNGIKSVLTFFSDEKVMNTIKGTMPKGMVTALNTGYSMGGH